MEDMFRVGVISSTHGVRGEVKVFPTTDDPARFRDLSEVTVDTGKASLVLTIQGVKFFKNMVILKFKGYDNINEIEPYKGCDLWIRRDQAVALEEGEYFIADLIGLHVVTDEGHDLGILDDVLKTGANDVYVVKMDSGKEVLIPVIPECVKNVDLEEKTVVVHLLDGLLDL
ncbi:MAG: 16S rRNA processing protein RimM [Lachnospiraceae bacterium]|nr:16S rRNA processing protein RimM [Lachnospiraceae bacterium]